MKIISLLVATILSGSATAQTLKINELMQSNVECIMDDLNEFPDSWVELYNPTDAAVNLKDYKISNKDKAKKAYQLPDREVPAGGYVLIYCDKEEKGLHTNFRLESGKDGNLYLFKGNDIVDKLELMAKMPAPDIAYGRKTDGADEWGYQLTPTPGTANAGGICDGKHILGAPVFGTPGCAKLMTGNIRLTLSLPDGAPEGTEIRYTTDGTEPTKGSTLYSNAFYVKSSTTVRAKLFCDGWLSPYSTVQSYIFLDRPMTLPVFSITTNDKYLNDSQIGLFANNNSKEDKNTHDWRRPMNIEFFPEEGQESAFNQLGELRIQGGQSRSNALKSMVFYANKRFDPNHKQYQYEFFPDQKPGISNFKSFSLRDGGNDFGDLYFRDAIIQRTMGSHVDLDWQACQSAVIYINGQYMGMINIRERTNEDNIYSNYNGLEDIDMVEISHEQSKEGNNLFLEEIKGSEDATAYDAFKAFYSQKGHTKAEYEEWLDVDEYLNVVIANLFYANIDFPGNNIVFWRPNDDDTESGLPKRWRAIIKDTDFGLGLYGRANDYNTIKLLYHPESDSGSSWAFSEPATRLIRNMLEDPDLLALFLDKCCVFMGDFMNARGTGKIIDLIKAEVMDEFVAHRAKYPSWGGNSREEINNNFEKAKKWLAGYTESNWWGSTTHQSRTDYFLTHLSTQWNLGTAMPVTINKGVTDLPDSVTVNGIRLSAGVFDGKFFSNRQLTIAAKAPEGKVVKGWKVVTTPKTGSQQTREYEGSTLTLTPSDSKSIAIEAILGDASGIHELANNPRSTSQGPYFDLLGNKVTTPQRGRIYILNGKKILWN